MKIGKLTDEQLRKFVLGALPQVRKDVLLRPGTGVDCGALRIGEMAVVASTDPITAGGKSAGALSIHVSANDVAASGAEPVGVLLTILAPPNCSAEELERVVRDAAQAAAAMNMEIIGGHTEVTDAVNRIVLSTTVLGFAPADGILSAAGGKPGMDIVVTKWAAIEGTVILAREYAEELKLTAEDVQQAEEMAQQISVVKEGAIAAGFGVGAMHDATEGGVLGAVWELASASGCGLTIWADRIPVLPLTQTVCREFSLNPLRLIASGSMIIACERGEDLVQQMQRQGIKATVVGRLTGDGHMQLCGRKGCEPIDPPTADELYRVKMR